MRYARIFSLLCAYREPSLLVQSASADHPRFRLIRALKASHAMLCAGQVVIEEPLPSSRSQGHFPSQHSFQISIYRIYYISQFENPLPHRLAGLVWERRFASAQSGGGSQLTVIVKEA